MPCVTWLKRMIRKKASTRIAVPPPPYQRSRPDLEPEPEPVPENLEQVPEDRRPLEAVAGGAPPAPDAPEEDELDLALLTPLASPAAEMPEPLAPPPAPVAPRGLTPAGCPLDLGILFPDLGGHEESKDEDDARM
mmetsp:Transcript_29278/g.87576  ORF Transcript_29278/g.87576 Transcript_29278/m.87576 type:complete len:135 (-) Transcript_29278:198-602(-)